MTTKVNTKTKSSKTKSATTKKTPTRPASVALTLKEVLKQLEALGDDKMRTHNAKHAPGIKQFGVKHGDIRVLAKKIKANSPMAIELWDTGILDAQYLAVLLIKPADLSAKELDRMVRTVSYSWVADWFINYVVKQHADKETLRQKWMTDKNCWAARAGWSLTAERIGKNPEGLDPNALLDRLESEMAGADPNVQWTMNNTLVAIGYHHPKLRKRAIAIAEKLGIYRDYPVSKGCTSPFAPIWIDYLIKTKG
jgi:3-methyladenine DNA glycosylase AlkD